MGKHFSLTSSDSFKLGAYRADPAGKSKGGIVVIQEIFGVNHHIRAVCDRLAAQGYTAVAPAVFDRQQPNFECGYTPDEIANARKFVANPDWGAMMRDVQAASGILAGSGPEAAITRNPRQDVQHAHLHAFYAEHDRTENHESSAVAGHPVIAEGHRAFSAALGSDAVPVERDSTSLAAGLRAAAQPWGGNYCSYQLGVHGPLWVMSALGPSQDEVNRRLARADGLQAEPDPTLAGAINLVRPSLADTGRLHAAQRATADQRASFETFVAQRGLNAHSLAADLAPRIRRAL